MDACVKKVKNLSCSLTISRLHFSSPINGREYLVKRFFTFGAIATREYKRAVEKEENHIYQDDGLVLSHSILFHFTPH